MPINQRSKLFSAVALLFGLSVSPSTAETDQQHCPAATRENSHVVCAGGCDPVGDKARLEMLAKEISKSKRPVCLLALIDSKDRGYWRKLAIKRVLWVRDTLIGYGVGSDRIAFELRPFEPDPAADKRALQRVGIILGR